MQLNKKLLPISLLLMSGTPLILNATSTDEVSLKQMKYQESDDRIGIDFTLLDIKKDFGADYSLSLSASFDAISGGTPVWNSVSGASSSLTSDDTSGASACLNEQNEYICKDTRDSALLSDGYSNTGEFQYSNVQIDDTRKAITTSLTKRTEGRDEISLGLAYSTESDFRSAEVSTSYLYNTDSSRNNSISIGASYQDNKVHFYREDEWKKFFLINTQVGYTYTFSKNTIGQINYFYIHQDGTLSNPYQTILREFDVSSDNTPYYKTYLASEKRPDKKNSAGVTLDIVSYFYDFISWHNDYRYYQDDWDVSSHTISSSAYFDVANNWSFVTLLRFYTQTEASFYKSHESNDFTFNETDYGSSDQRLSAFNSLSGSVGFEKKIEDFSFNAHVAYSKQSFGLTMGWISIGASYEF